MTTEPEAAHLVGSVADERLLESADALPVAVGRPEPVAPVPGRAAIVAVGTAMTGLSLVGGIALVILGIVLAIANSGATLGDGGLVAAGVLLAGTHWGWVHVAEAIATARQVHSAQVALARREQWLRGLAPFPHHEVVTEVEDDGAIAIVSVCYRPVETRPGRFTFVRAIEARERHEAEAPAAVVTDRAEALRRAAAQATERERELFLAAADRRETELLRQEDERAARDVQRATSRALSEQINANLRQPPLDG
jgi:hypothetical protein